ncbi:hypothetical protein [Rhodospirillum sp. A1_3_36]|uniref:hypothetical protein n=1 Tax=Rhodospirillum sp. A1_3_36 TaxID=3391666 RepID=UPI0039A5AEFC
MSDTFTKLNETFSKLQDNLIGITDKIQSAPNRQERRRHIRTTLGIVESAMREMDGGLRTIDRELKDLAVQAARGRQLKSDLEAKKEAIAEILKSVESLKG